MKKLSLCILLVFPGHVLGSTLESDGLLGKWIPSGDMPRVEGASEYTLKVKENLDASYEALERDLRLECKYKPSDSQFSVFVWYCYKSNKHLITISLAGWNSSSGKLLYGYEYWLGDPAPGEIYGGLPLSLKPANQ